MSERNDETNFCLRKGDVVQIKLKKILATSIFELTGITSESLFKVVFVANCVDGSQTVVVKGHNPLFKTLPIRKSRPGARKLRLADLKKLTITIRCLNTDLRIVSRSLIKAGDVVRFISNLATGPLSESFLRERNLFTASHDAGIEYRVMHINSFGGILSLGYADGSAGEFNIPSKYMEPVLPG